MNKPRTHFIAEYIANPVHPITVDLIGCGGNGSIMLSCLASIHTALKALGKEGLDVTAYDNDIVEEPNLGRQLFSPADLGCNKADALISRFNRCFGLEWKSVPEKYRYNEKTNIIITCTDNTESRKYVGSRFNSKKNHEQKTTDEFRNYYWLDTGNRQTSGQVILGSTEINQPHSAKFESVEKLPTVTEMFKLTKSTDKESGPSCSLAEALEKQDLFINRTVSTTAADILWKLLRNGHIEMHGAYINLEEMRTLPINV